MIAIFSDARHKIIISSYYVMADVITDGDIVVEISLIFHLQVNMILQNLKRLQF